MCVHVLFVHVCGLVGGRAYVCPSVAVKMMTAAAFLCQVWLDLGLPVQCTANVTCIVRVMIENLTSPLGSIGGLTTFG